MNYWKDRESELLREWSEDLDPMRGVLMGMFCAACVFVPILIWMWWVDWI